MTARSLYFVNRWVDSLAVGGLSILTATAPLALADASDTVVLTALVFPVALLVNYPHFSATVYRLYQNPDNLREFPVTAIGLPVLLLGAVTAGLCQPELIAPYFVMLYLLWSPYHYSGQTVGLTLVYARCAGFASASASGWRCRALCFRPSCAVRSACSKAVPMTGSSI